MSSLEISDQSPMKQADEIGQCIRFRNHLKHKYETTDRLIFHCASNIMYGVINRKIAELRTYCLAKIGANRICQFESDNYLPEHNRTTSDIGKWSKSIENLSTICIDEDDDSGAEEKTFRQASTQGYPKRVVRQVAKTFTLTRSDTIVINIASEWIAEPKLIPKTESWKNVNATIVKTFLNDRSNDIVF